MCRGAPCSCSILSRGVLSSQQKNEACVLDIPQQTKSERELDELNTVQHSFGEQEDISGLDLTNRRQRKVNVFDIDEYIKQLEQESGDGPPINPQTSEIRCIEAGVFNDSYKMKITEEPPARRRISRQQSESIDLGMEKSAGFEEQFTKNTHLAENDVDLKLSQCGTQKSEKKHKYFAQVCAKLKNHGSQAECTENTKLSYTSCPLGLYCRVTAFEAAVKSLDRELQQVVPPLSERSDRPKPRESTSKVLPTTSVGIATHDTIYMNESLQDSKIFMKKHSINLLRRNTTQISPSPHVSHLKKQLLSPMASPTSHDGSPGNHTRENVLEFANVGSAPPDLLDTIRLLRERCVKEADQISYKLVPPRQSDEMIFELEEQLPTECSECPGLIKACISPGKGIHEGPEDRKFSLERDLLESKMTVFEKDTGNLSVPECIQLLVWDLATQVAVVLVFQSRDADDPDNHSLWRLHIHSAETDIQQLGETVTSFLGSQMQQDSLFSLKRFIRELLSALRPKLQHSPPIHSRRRSSQRAEADHLSVTSNTAVAGSLQPPKQGISPLQQWPFSL